MTIDKFKVLGKKDISPLQPKEMFAPVPTSILTLKTAARPNHENTPPWAAVCKLAKPQHLVVYFTFKKLFPNKQKAVITRSE